MNLYESIFKRKSVRKYLMEPVPNGYAERIFDIISNAVPLYPDIKIRFDIIDTLSTPELAPEFAKVKSPYYLVISSEKKEGYFENIGFMAEQIVLGLTALGLATCWFVQAKLCREVANQLELDYIMMISFGKGDVQSIYHTSMDKIDRFPINSIWLNYSIGITQEKMEIMEAVRIAPSASNKQPWRIYLNPDNTIDLYSIKNVVPPVPWRLVDMGIAIAHIYIYLKNSNKDFFFDRRFRSINGLDYIGTVSDGNEIEVKMEKEEEQREIFSLKKQKKQ